MIKRMDLNADLGESWYTHRIGNDAELMPLLNSCNIACGFHGGDAVTLRNTIDLALEHKVAIGAHPSFPDRKHFGRRPMDIPAPDLYALLLYQVSALKGMVEAAGGVLHHLKPHGALYHYLNAYIGGADALARVAVALHIPLIYGPPTGQLQLMAHVHELTFWAEGFADRAYEPSLHLRSRQKEGATLEDQQVVMEQVRMLVEEKAVVATDGKRYPLEVQTICIHGDHPGAVARARHVRELLVSLG
ncbi:MAG: 5-oxoprolinase subunit PxpA [Bacteroidota bacterium]